MSWAGSVECVCTCGAPGLTSLTQQLLGAVRLAQLRQAGPSPSQLARCRPLALRVLDLLRDKLADLAARRAALKVMTLYFLLLNFAHFSLICTKRERERDMSFEVLY